MQVASLAIAIAGALTFLVGYATVKLALDEGTAAAALTMLLVGITLTIAGWRGSRALRRPRIDKCRPGSR